MVTTEIYALKTKMGDIPPNLSQTQVQALKKLRTYSHLTIKPADKGGCIVVMDNDKYKKICLDILNNPTWYKPISFEIMEQFMVDFYQLVDDAFHSGIINKNNWKFIRTPLPRLSTFYCLPKVHKPGPDLKGRPIISGSGNLTEGASKFVDCVLRPHVETMFSYVKDTPSFLKFMDGLTAPVGSILVTIDIECLYNSIPHEWGVQVITTFLDQMHPSQRPLDSLCSRSFKIHP